MSTPQPNRSPTRAELIERIRAASKDAVVLQEMQRLGFWPKDQGEPSLETALLQREAELQKALSDMQIFLFQERETGASNHPQKK